MAEQRADERSLQDAIRKLAQTRHDLNGFVEAIAQRDLLAEIAELPEVDRRRAITLFCKKADRIREDATSIVRTTARNMCLPSLQRYAPKDPDKPSS